MQVKNYQFVFVLQKSNLWLVDLFKRSLYFHSPFNPLGHCPPCTFRCHISTAHGVTVVYCYL